MSFFKQCQADRVKLRDYGDEEENWLGVPDARFIRTFIYSDAFLDVLHDSFLGVAQS